MDRYDEQEQLVERLTSPYVRRLLAERHYIRAKLFHQGGSIVLTATARVDHDRPVDYPTQIGSSVHADLIELERQLAELPAEDRRVLEAWADNLSAEQAAHLLSAKGKVAVRKRRSRAVRKLTDRMNSDEQ